MQFPGPVREMATGMATPRCPEPAGRVARPISEPRGSSCAPVTAESETHERGLCRDGALSIVRRGCPAQHASLIDDYDEVHGVALSLQNWPPSHRPQGVHCYATFPEGQSSTRSLKSGRNKASAMTSKLGGSCRKVNQSSVNSFPGTAIAGQCSATAVAIAEGMNDRLPLSWTQPTF